MQQPRTARTLSMHSADPPVFNFSRFLKQNRLLGRRISRDKSYGCVKFTECHFVPIEAIESYFRNRDTLEALLRCVHGNDEPPVDVETIRHGYLRLFCILFSINRGNLISHCFDARIEDSKLPFSSAGEFPAELADIDADFRSAFMHQQWYFFPHKFQPYHMDITCADLVIYPFISTEAIDVSDGRTITKVVIHPGYHNLRPSHQDASNQVATDRNVFVLKSLDGTDSENLRCYQSEVKAFRKLGCNGLSGSNRDPPSEIIRFYGSFKQCGNYHILLEYAELGTLYDYFKNTPPPQTPIELDQFWSSMEAITRGTSRIHLLLPENETIGVFQGYHQDLKLSNILVFKDDPTSQYLVKLKIADLGLSNFVRGQSYVSNASGQGQPGTRTFGSPESHQLQQYSSGRFKSGQAADVWSVACIFSVAATWVIGGWKLVEQYTRFRQQARQRCGKAISDSFHDDENALEEIETWHLVLLNNAKNFDNVTPQLWTKLLEPAFSPEQSRSDALKFQLAFTGLYNTRIDKDRTRSSTWDMSQLPMHGPDSISRPSAWSSHSRGFSSDNIQGRHERPLELGRADRVQSDTELHTVSPILHSIFTEEPLESDTDRNPQAALAHYIGPTLQIDHRPILSSKSTPTTTSQSLQSSSGYNNISSRSVSTNQQLHIIQEPISDPKPTSTRLADQPQGDQANVPSTSLELDATSHGQTKGRSSMTDPVHSRTCPKHPSNRKVIDHMSRADLTAWKLAQEENRRFEVPHSSLGESLRGRDFVFLFEDSISMRTHWSDVCRLFSEVSKFIKHYDKDGIEVCFTVSKDRHTDKKTRSLCDKVASKQDTLNCSSEPTSALERIWKSYQNGLRYGKRASFLGKKQNVGLTVYVFTDGIWRNGALANMKAQLREMVEFLEAHHCDRKHVGVQFIQFGDGEAETAQLEALDKDLRRELKRDIVDRESANGNVWKMLLGTVDDSFDDDEEVVCNCSARVGSA